MTLEEMQDAIASRTRNPVDALRAANGGTLPPFAAQARKENKLRKPLNGNATMESTAAAKSSGVQGGRKVIEMRSVRQSAVMANLPATSAQLAKACGISQAYVSELLSQLRKEGLIDFSRKGNISIWAAK